MYLQKFVKMSSMQLFRNPKIRQDNQDSHNEERNVAIQLCVLLLFVKHVIRSYSISF